MRAWPIDLDVNFHVNNGRYLTLMDIGRFDLMVRTGLVGAALKNGWYPVVGNATVTYRASLGPFQAFQMLTKVLAWDEKWIFIQQDFVSDGRLYARGVIRGQLRTKKSGAVPPAELLQRLGQEGIESPALPPDLAHWVAGLKLPRRD